MIPRVLVSKVMQDFYHPNKEFDPIPSKQEAWAMGGGEGAGSPTRHVEVYQARFCFIN